VWFSSYDGQTEILITILCVTSEGETKVAGFDDNNVRSVVLRDFTARCQNRDLVWKYADWVLQRNEVLGVQVGIVTNVVWNNIHSGFIFSFVYSVAQWLSI